MIDKLKTLYRNKYILYPLLLGAVFVLAFWYVFDAKIDLNGDNAKYYLLAKSIVEGQGYAEIYTPGEPVTSIYPPGYPLLMSVVMLFTKSVTYQKILNGLLLLGSALLLFFSVDRLLDRPFLSFSISVFTVVNYHLLKFATIMMSEMAFLLFSVVSFWGLVKLRREHPLRDPYFYVLLFALAFAFHVRTQGIGLVGGVLFYFLFTRQWRHFGLTAGGFVLLALPWRLRNQLVGLGSSRYLDQLVQVNPWRPETGTVSVTGILGRFVDQGTMLVTKAIPDSIFNFVTVDYQAETLPYEWVLGIVALGVMLYGFWCFRRYRLFFLGYFLAVFVIVASWSATIDNRYLVTIIPFLQVGFFYGLYRIVAALIENANSDLNVATVVPAAFLVVGLGMLPQLSVLRAQAERPYPGGYRNYFQSANELGQKRNCQNTVVACRKPALFYLFSNCYVTRYAFSTDDEKIIRDMVSEGVDYVILDQLGFSSTPRYLYPAIKKNRSLFRAVIVKEKPKTYVLRFDAEKAKEVIGAE
jgi:hypothetical protein